MADKPQSDVSEPDVSQPQQPDAVEHADDKFSALRAKVLGTKNNTGTVAEALGRRNFLLALVWVTLIALAFTFEQLKTRWEYLTIELKNKRTQDLATSERQEVTLPSGLKYVEIKPGAGPTPQLGDLLLVEYTLKLLDGTPILSSRDPGEKALGFTFDPAVQPSELIPMGLIEGISTMHKGGKRRLIVPPDLGFGDQPIFFSQGTVAANSTLVYEVELVKVSIAPS